MYNEGMTKSRLQLSILLEIQPFKLSVLYGAFALAYTDAAGVRAAIVVVSASLHL